ncbi:MAG: acetate--CoA ligase family protein, partial [Acetobacteraceae bacterium]
LVHKSDLGMVRLGLRDTAAVADAASEMAARARATLPKVRIDGFAVQETVQGEAEVIIGIRNDAQFGPILVLGLGGVAVEILRDVAVAPAPLARSRVQRMIAELRTAPLFFGARGRPPLDTDSIADAVERVSWLAADLGPRLVDLEINPLIVGREGTHAVAVDVRGVFR